MRNTMKTSLVIASLIMGGSLGACAQSQTQSNESTGNYVDDASITTKVKTALLGDVGLKVFDIHVDTHHDVVQLTGAVNSQRMINHAGDIASQVAGVTGVQNELVVR
jgi:osmotically-inducible protein OsmY